VSRTIARIARPYRIEDGRRFRIADWNPGDTAGWKKAECKAALAPSIERLAALQEKLYAQDSWAVLLIIQAMDAAGKDSLIEHVMSGLNPQGCEVYSFKQPSLEELNHDFLWRTNRRLPERGRIGIFNRSYYEEMLIVRVHPQILAGQRLPRSLITKRIWKERFEDVVALERYLSRNGTRICKFFLNVSRDEQRRRFLDRIEMPEKNWKFSLADVEERGLWKNYMSAYEDVIRNTATRHAPWYVVPADNKWYTRLVVAAAMIDTLEDLAPAFPKLDAKHRSELDTARNALLQENGAAAARKQQRAARRT